MKNTVEVIVLVVYLAIVFTLVRPGSQGPALVKVFGESIASIITAATGSGSWGSAASEAGGRKTTVYA